MTCTTEGLILLNFHFLFTKQPNEQYFYHISSQNVQRATRYCSVLVLQQFDLNVKCWDFGRWNQWFSFDDAELKSLCLALFIPILIETLKRIDHQVLQTAMDPRDTSPNGIFCAFICNLCVVHCASLLSFAVFMEIVRQGPKTQNTRVFP